MAEPVRFQHYEVGRRGDGSLDELGRGAMGVTYRAFDTNLQCFVALKVISSAYLEDDMARQRFLREARAAAALRHPNVASVFHLGEEGGDCFYAMEFVVGETLESMMKRAGTVPLATALDITLQVASALGAAEKQQLVHRDLKPANLMVVPEDGGEFLVKVIDFGLAKNATGSGNADAATVTMGGFLGTPHFASPEQLEEREIDIRSDFYALGVTLFYMLAGRAPFGGSIAQVMSQHLHREPPFELLAGVPPQVVDLIRRMLAKDPASRPQTAAALRAEIEACIAACPAAPADAASATIATPVAMEDFATQVAAPPEDLATMVMPERPVPAPVPATRRRAPWSFAVAAVLLLGGAGAGVFVVLREQPATATAPVTQAEEPPPTPAAEPVLPADPLVGKLAAADAAAAGSVVEGFPIYLALLQEHPDRKDFRERVGASLASLRAASETLNPNQWAALREPLESAAGLEFADASLILAGELKETDPAAALDAYKVAAGLGSVDAMLAAANLMVDGTGLPAPDPEGAVVWFEKAAELGDTRARFSLAECYRHGIGVAPDPGQAVKLLSMPSQQNDPRSMGVLGQLYIEGVPGALTPDGKEAFRLLKAATDGGFLDAQGNLGILYLNGEGVAPDAKIGLELISDGAAKGNALCVFLYARLLEAGIPGLLVPDVGAAGPWYVKAAQAGIAPAKKWCLERGIPFEIPAP